MAPLPERKVVTHGGAQAVAAARAHGVQTMFTLSGGHIFPVYDGAVNADPPMPILDVRHEQTAVFAAEATARLTRTPGWAVLTAGPGVTNGISAITTAHFNSCAVVVLGGRAPDYRWGAGSLQEFDHPALLGPITKRAWTEHDLAKVGQSVSEAFELATARHRGPVFLDVSLEALFGTPPEGEAEGEASSARAAASPEPAKAPAETGPDDDQLASIARLLAGASRPVLVLGSDVWLDGAEHAARAAAEELDLPVITNGQGRGVLPAGHRLLMTRARSVAFGEADLVVVVGTPLDFRLGYGEYGGKNGTQQANVVHVADAPAQVAKHVSLAAQAAGPLEAFFHMLVNAANRASIKRAWRTEWLPKLTAARDQAVAGDQALLGGDAIVIGDGGDFVSYAGKYVEPSQPGGWLDPGPYGCLGTGLGYAIAARVARPSAQVVLLLGDGASGFSLMDVDTLVRHRLPVVMICGNNGIWGLEKHPMRAIYGWDVAADLAPGCRYDRVVTALGGHGELVEDPAALGPALRRAFEVSRDTSLPAMVNVVLDPEVAYPR